MTIPTLGTGLYVTKFSHDDVVSIRGWRDSVFFKLSEPLSDFRPDWIALLSRVYILKFLEITYH